MLRSIFLSAAIALSPVAASAHYLDFSKFAFWNVRGPNPGVVAGDGPRFAEGIARGYKQNKPDDIGRWMNSADFKTFYSDAVTFSEGVGTFGLACLDCTDQGPTNVTLFHNGRIFQTIRLGYEGPKANGKRYDLVFRHMTLQKGDTLRLRIDTVGPRRTRPNGITIGDICFTRDKSESSAQASMKAPAKADRKNDKAKDRREQKRDRHEATGGKGRK